MRERDILKICHLFYNEGMTQIEIASMMGLSRFKIGRIIKDARDRGLVSITINHPQSDLTETEIVLAKKFAINEAIVVNINEFSGKSALDQLGAAGAQYLTSIVDRHRILGVTWGQTVSYVAKNLPIINARHLKLVQIGGGLGTIEGTDNPALTMMLGQKLGAEAHVIQAPIIVRDKTIRDTFLKEEKTRETLEIAKRADIVMFGVGLVGSESLLWQSGFLDHEDAARLRTAGAVGAICGRFFNRHGTQCWQDLADRTIGLSLEELKRIKHKILIATGREKVQAILGALKGDLVDVLIVDLQTAERLLAN
ncbi:MAG: sugar-binding transcriptional regulator [Desulfobacterales bacterium]|nr:MAG: sugar-binding transcriptional regulator [Desulfobacterales bacterium]